MLSKGIGLDCYCEAYLDHGDQAEALKCYEELKISNRLHHVTWIDNEKSEIGVIFIRTKSTQSVLCFALLFKKKIPLLLRVFMEPGIYQKEQNQKSEERNYGKFFIGENFYNPYIIQNEFENILNLRIKCYKLAHELSDEFQDDPYDSYQIKRQVIVNLISIPLFYIFKYHFFILNDKMIVNSLKQKSNEQLNELGSWLLDLFPYTIFIMSFYILYQLSMRIKNIWFASLELIESVFLNIEPFFANFFSAVFFTLVGYLILRFFINPAKFVERNKIFFNMTLRPICFSTFLLSDTTLLLFTSIYTSGLKKLDSILQSYSVHLNDYLDNQIGESVNKTYHKECFVDFINRNVSETVVESKIKNILGQ